MQTQTNSQNNVNNAAGEKFFDLHTRGVGYLNRVRAVPSRSGEYWSCDIVAIHGKAGSDMNSVRFDLIVKGDEAGQAVRQFQNQANDKNSQVLVGFKIGDLKPEIFTYSSGQKQGQQGISLKGRLLTIDWVKVDGQTAWHSARESARADDPELYSESPAQPSQLAPAPMEVPAQVAPVVQQMPVQPQESAPQSMQYGYGPEVRLSKDDPNFEAIKTDLKSRGYRFDGKDLVWRLPQVA